MTNNNDNNSERPDGHDVVRDTLDAIYEMRVNADRDAGQVKRLLKATRDELGAAHQISRSLTHLRNEAYRLRDVVGRVSREAQNQRHNPDLLQILEAEANFASVGLEAITTCCKVLINDDTLYAWSIQK